MVDTVSNQDCLVGMEAIPDGSVDMVLCDLPYGVTHHKWDSILPLDELWGHYNRVTKVNGAVVLFADEPFTNRLIRSNLRNFKYKWIWNKGRGNNFQSVRYQPFKCHEEICVFYRRFPTYNPQWWYSTPYHINESKRRKRQEGLRDTINQRRTELDNPDGRRYPLSILNFPKDGTLHPSQKPVALLQYLIKTYTDAGDVVLDNCCGSGSTLVAAVNTGRRYIGFETDPDYYDICCQRLDVAEGWADG